MNLQDIRDQIDAIDQQLLELLQKRFEYAMQTKQFKTILFDSDREIEVKKHWKDIGSNLGIRPSFSEKLCSLIIQESIELQNNGNNTD